MSKKKKRKGKNAKQIRTKYRKAFKGRIHGTAARAVKLNYGQYGLKAIQPDRIIGKQIEAARVALTRYMKEQEKYGQEFSNIPVSKNRLKLEWKGKGFQNIMLVG